MTDDVLYAVDVVIVLGKEAKLEPREGKGSKPGRRPADARPR
ncbi:hypothetical protein [Arthrobacter sp. B6]